MILVVHFPLWRLCVAAILTLSGCDRERRAAPEPTAADATARATAPVPTAPVPTAPPREPAAEEARDVTEPRAGEDWLIWFRRGDGFHTRWVHVEGASSEVVAERDAIVVSDGARLWRLVRRDAVDSVTTCGCVTGGAACEVVGRLTRPGLAALGLADGRETTIVRATTDGTAGEELQVSLRLNGGAGALLFFETGERGYECGAHAVYEMSPGVFDLTRGERREELYPSVAAKLPASVRDPAVAELATELARCDGEALAADEIGRRMALEGVHVALDAAGEPALSWSFVMPLPYVCAPDYRARGAGDSRLLAEASELSLGGPVPAGLATALAEIGDAPTAGLSRVTLAGDARAAAVARFEAVPATPWPAESWAVVPIEEPAEAQEALAMRSVRAGRQLVRDGDYDAALIALDRAVSLAPELALARSGRGHARLMAGDLAGAKEDLDEALKLDAGPVFAAQIHYHLGQVAERGGDLATARAEYARSLELRPNPAVQAALARVSR